MYAVLGFNDKKIVKAKGGHGVYKQSLDGKPRTASDYN